MLAKQYSAVEKKEIPVAVQHVNVTYIKYHMAVTRAVYHFS
jgi:hypothetical protein